MSFPTKIVNELETITEAIPELMAACNLNEILHAL